MKTNTKLCNYKAQTCMAKEICEAPNKLNGEGRDILCSTTHLQMNYRIIRGPACHLDKMNLRKYIISRLRRKSTSLGKCDK